MAVEMYACTKTLAPFTAKFSRHYTVGLLALLKPSREDCLDGKSGGDRNPTPAPSSAFHLPQISEIASAA